MAHETGPGTPAVAASLEPQDRQIARLVREMEARDLFATTTLIFVSDHGMVEATERVNLARALRRAGLDCSVLGIGGFASVVFGEGASTPENLKKGVAVAKQAGLEAWPRDRAPSDWHVDDVRFGDIVVRAPIGTAIVGRTTRIDGFHGYDSKEPSMAGLLVARGRGVVPGAKLGRISNLAIAPTVLRLLDLPIPPQMQVPPIPSLISGLESTENRVDISAIQVDGAGSGLPETDLPADLPNDLPVEEQGT